MKKHDKTLRIFMFCIALALFFGNVFAQKPKDETIENMNFIFKETVQINSSQMYLSPLNETHLGKYATYRNYLLTTSPVGRYFLGTGSKSRITGELFLATNIRIMNNEGFSPRYNRKETWNVSVPVRTPSYTGGGVFYYSLGNKVKKENAKDFLKSNSNENTAYKYKYLKVKIFHHSNGQDGDHSPKYQKDVFKLIKSSNSTFPLADSSKLLRDFNTFNGNFGVNLIFETGITFNNYSSKIDHSDNLKTYNLKTYYIGIESGQTSSVLFGLPLGEKTLKGVYGLEKINFIGQWISGKELKENEKIGEMSVYEKKSICIKCIICT